MRDLVTPYKQKDRWLPEIQGIEKYQKDNSRGYFYKGKLIPYSITQITDTRKDYVKKIHEDTQKDWEPRGNTAHHCLEQFLKGRSYDPGEYKPLVDRVVNYWIWDEWEAIGCEYKLFDLKRGIAGTADMILRNKKDHSRIAVADLKTKKDKITFQDYKAQIGGYINLMNLCYPELIIEECFVIAASNTAIDMRVYDWNECLDIYENQRRLFFDRLEVF